MISFIYIATVLMFILLLIAFAFRIYALGALSSFGLMVLGIFILSEGIEGITQHIAISLGVIFICIGAFIIIKGSIELLEGDT